jgi:hypothetical protein
MRAIIVLLLLIISSNSYSQFDSSKMTKLDIFHSKLNLVNYADLRLNDDAKKYIISRGIDAVPDIIAIKQFILEDLKLYGVVVTSEDREIAYLNSTSVTEIVFVSWKMGVFNSELGAIGNYPFEIEFTFADNSSYSFSFPVNVSGLTMSFPKAILRGLRKTITTPEYKKLPYTYTFPKGDLVFTNAELEDYLKAGNIKNEVEGVYQLFTGSASFNKLAIVKKDGKFYLVNVENKYFNSDWSVGELKGILEPTLSPKLFTGKMKNIIKEYFDITLSVSGENMIEIVGNLSKEKFVFVKIK